MSTTLFLFDLFLSLSPPSLIYSLVQRWKLPTALKKGGGIRRRRRGQTLTDRQCNLPFVNWPYQLRRRRRRPHDDLELCLPLFPIRCPENARPPVSLGNGDMGYIFADIVSLPPRALIINQRPMTISLIFLLFTLSNWQFLLFPPSSFEAPPKRRLLGELAWGWVVKKATLLPSEECVDSPASLRCNCIPKLMTAK